MKTEHVMELLRIYATAAAAIFLTLLALVLAAVLLK